MRASREVALRARPRPTRLGRTESVYFHILISPWLMGFLIFTLYPVAASLYYSLTRFNVINPPKWIGLSNYIQLFHDNLFYQSLFVTVYYIVLQVPITIMVSLAVASLLNLRIPGMRIFRAMYYLPTLTPAVANALLWTWLLNPQFGLLNVALYFLFHVQGPEWLVSRHWVIPALVLMGTWGFGGTMVIYLAALQGIPREFLEAAAIDGATSWRRYTRIVLPLLSPAIFFTLILGIIGSFQIFTQPYILTGGGPDYASYFYNLYLYQNAFEYYKMGMASAQAWILFVIILVFTIVLLKFGEQWIHYER